MKASDVIRDKLDSLGGKSRIFLLNNDLCNVEKKNNYCFICDKLPNQEVDFEIFDIVVKFLLKHYGHADKGSARNSKVGLGQCSRDTVMYAIATEYYGKKDGESSFDPLFVIAAILDWANVAKNERGYIQLINPSLWEED